MLGVSNEHIVVGLGLIFWLVFDLGVVVVVWHLLHWADEILQRVVDCILLVATVLIETRGGVR